MFGAEKFNPSRAQWIEVARLRAEVERMRNGGLDYAVKVRRKRSILAALPIKGLFYIFLGLAVFKAIALGHLGGEAYDARLQLLRDGTVFEQAGAWVMKPDPITIMIAAQVAPVLR